MMAKLKPNVIYTSVCSSAPQSYIVLVKMEKVIFLKVRAAGCLKNIRGSGYVKVGPLEPSVLFSDAKPNQRGIFVTFLICIMKIFLN